MDRTTLLVVGFASLTCAACGGAIVPGLPNVPALGGSSSVDTRPVAIVANGDEACAGEGSSLRGKYPPCPRVEETRDGSGWSMAMRPKIGATLTVPWRRENARKWPCLEKLEPAMAVATAPMEILPASCAFTR